MQKKKSKLRILFYIYKETLDEHFLFICKIEQLMNKYVMYNVCDKLIILLIFV